MKSRLILFLLLLSLVTSAYKKPELFVIKAEANAFYHNNVGLSYVWEKAYYAAIQEFKIAISLNPNTQATATYYNNLGEVYMIIGQPKYAQDCFERAITQYSLNFKFYQNLAKCFKAQNLVDYKIKTYSADTKNPLNMLMVGLLQVEKGDIRRGIIKLDEFTMQEPDLLITGSVKAYIKTLVAQQS